MKKQKYLKMMVVFFSAIVVMSSYGCGKKDAAPDSENSAATDSAGIATGNEKTDASGAGTEDSASNSEKKNNSKKKNSKNKSKKKTKKKSKKSKKNKSKKKKNVSTKYKKYKGKGYRISFPKKWYIADKSIAKTVGADSVYYYKNPKNKEFTPNVNVMLQRLSAMGIDTLEKYKTLSLNQFEEYGVKADCQNLSVNGMDVLSVEYETDAFSEGIVLHYYSWATIKDGTIFLFTYTSSLEDNPALRKSIDKIYKTIAIE